AAAPAPVIPASASAPVIMRCPECGGSLRVTSDSARTIACDHCNNNVYLPDDLWRSLHPVKRAAFWTIAWDLPPLAEGIREHLPEGFGDGTTPRLVSVADIQRAERELASARAKDLAERAQRDAEAAEATAAAARVAATNRRLRATLIALGIALALAIFV